MSDGGGGDGDSSIEYQQPHYHPTYLMSRRDYTIIQRTFCPPETIPSSNVPSIPQRLYRANASAAAAAQSSASPCCCCLTPVAVAEPSPVAPPSLLATRPHTQCPPLTVPSRCECFGATDDPLVVAVGTADPTVRCDPAAAAVTVTSPAQHDTQELRYLALASCALETAVAWPVGGPVTGFR